MNYPGRYEDQHPPRGRGSNYERRQFCRRCQTRTLHLYDHGEGVHLCTECEL